MNNDLWVSPDLQQGDQRLVSLDALRGFDMFWIIGGESIAHAAANLTGWAWLVWLSGQLHHPEWHGFSFYDLIFPLFLFIAGVAMPLSLDTRRTRGDSKLQVYRHIVLRGLLLVLLGMIYNGLLTFDWATMRYPSVLGRIGLAYLFAALIVMNAGMRQQLAWIAALLIGYWAALKFVPVPGYGAGDLAPGHTLTDYIDRWLLSGHLYHGDRDPEGLLATVPAIATALIGAVTGRFLKNVSFSGYAKTATLTVAGFACLGLALLWNLDFPINKNLWSSSFVLYCAGWSLLLVSVFYLIMDVLRVRSWTLPLVVIGCNSIFIYMAQEMIDFGFTTHYFFDGILINTGSFQPLLWAIAILAVKWLLLYWLYSKRVFFKV